MAQFDGSDFDRWYADLEVQDHIQDIQEAKDEVKSGCKVPVVWALLSQRLVHIVVWSTNGMDKSLANRRGSRPEPGFPVPRVIDTDYGRHRVVTGHED